MLSSCVCLSVCLSVRLSVCSHDNMTRFKSSRTGVKLSLSTRGLTNDLLNTPHIQCLSNSGSVCLSVRLFVCLSVCLFVCMSVPDVQF